MFFKGPVFFRKEVSVVNMTIFPQPKIQRNSVSNVWCGDKILSAPGTRIQWLMTLMETSDGVQCRRDLASLSGVQGRVEVEVTEVTRRSAQHPGDGGH